MSTTHKLFGERILPSKQQLKRKLRQATVDSDFQMKPGYLYTVVRAISARVNQNYDGWPSEELKKSYHTFIGKPVFVNHENYDPKTARGVVVAARYVENGRDKYIEVIQEIDAPTFPLLAHEIKTGGLDSVSMGAEAGFTICSVCDNKAVDEHDMCHHVMFHKGEMLPRRNAKTGKVERVLCYESCHKLGFFELSYVFDPADETAVASKVMMAADNVGRLAGKYTKEDFAIDDGKLPWEREVDDALDKEVVAFFKRADNECLPGEDCDSGTAGPSGDEVKSDPNLQPLTPGSGSSGGGSSSAPAEGTSSPVGGGGSGTSSVPVPSGNGSIPITHNPDGTISSPNPAWNHLIDRESGGRNVTQQITDVNSGGNEAQGYFQITPSTWKSNGGDKYAPNPEGASAEQQADIAKNIFNRNPSGSDWGAGLSGREDASALAQGISGPNPAAPKNASFEARVLTAAGFKAPPAENSAYTQIPGTMPTYQKAHAAFDSAGAPTGNTLDYGAGLGHSAAFGDTFEPHPQKGFAPTHQRTEDIPDGSYHRVTNLNVLNVVPPKVRDHIVGEIGRVMAPGGHAIITTRGANEVAATKGGIPAGNNDPGAIIVGQGTPKERYQKGFSPKELHQYVSGRLGDGYDVSPLKLGPAGVHIVRKAGKQAATQRRAWGETEAPTRVDTLREEGSAPEDDSDDFYHFVESPRELRTPDLSQAAELDREQAEQGQAPDDMPGAEADDPDAGQYITLKIPVPPQTQSEALPSHPFDAGPDGVPPGPPPPQAPPPGPPGAAPSGPPGPAVVPGAQAPGEPPQQIAASTLAYFNDYFGHRVANWYDAVAQGREMTAAERADYQLQASTLRNTASVSTTNRNPTKGTADMGRSTLASRGNTASRNRRQHFAEGPLTDGGDVSRNDQGEQEEAFISETPPEENVVAPTDDTPNISNTENNLVARVQAGRAQLLRDAKQLAALRARQGSRRVADEKSEAGGPVATAVDPPLSGTDDQSLKGDDFMSANPNDGVESTQPKDASLKAFKTFDAWLKRKTGKSSNQHTAATIRRYAEHYANYKGESVQAYFPALGIVLREARKNEKAAAEKRKPAKTKGANMRKRANESLEVAAPDGRADVEAPVRNTTDAEAQASQFDVHDFGNNAGDDIAKPDLSTDQNWAPGEANKSAARTKTAGELLGIRCAEAMIDAGLEPNDRQRKYALAAEFGNMSRGLILDRIALTERFAAVLQQERAANARKVASGGTRGATRSPIPAGMSSGAPRQMTAGQRRTAANDPSNDSLMFG